MDHMTERRKTSTPVSVTDLKSRLALLKANGVTFYNDGLLELHITGKSTVPGKKPTEMDKDVELGPV
jgi:hypothetical protein